MAILFAVLLLARPVHAADPTLVWRSDKQVLDAELINAPLIPALERLAATTGWHIYLEPTDGKTLTAKFTGLARGDAMRKLIGDLNYAFVSPADGPTKLFIFRTSMGAATQVIRAAPAKPELATPKRVPNQLIVNLKPGMKIEEIAAQLGAKVKGKIPGMNAYLLEFEDETATESGRAQLASNAGVESVDSNFYVERPSTPQPVTGNLPPPVQLALRPPTSADGRIIVGLIDTPVQSLGGGLDSFMLAQISAAGEAGALGAVPTHGTSMAETLLRSLQNATGGNTSVQILPVDVYGANATTTTYDVANGIVQAVNGGATLINLSLGSDSDSTFLHNLIKDVTGKQIPVFGAAGNQPVTTPFYPAAYPEVIAVTASSQGQIANYANHGNFVDMIAPGTSVVYYGGQAYLVSGTSAASAYATGLAAGVADSQHVSPASAAARVQSSMTFTTTGK